METRAEILETIREFVLLNFVMADETLGEHESLTYAGIVDSTGLLELVLFLEDTFGLTIAQEDVLPERFDSLALLTDYVQAQRSLDTPALA